MVRLLVAALEEELVAFPATIPGVATVVTGPGKVLAATGLAAAIKEHRPDSVLVVGTAGWIGPSRPRLGRVLFPSATVQTDATNIDDIVGRSVSAPRSLPIDGGSMALVVGTADAFVADQAHAARIRALDPLLMLVDMETYAYVHVALRHGIPITVAKAVSDGADEHAGGGWARAVAECSAALWAEVRDEL